MAKHKTKHKPMKMKHRNSAGGMSAPARPRSSPRRALRRGDPPDFWTTVAAVAGGAGSAVLSGLVVNQKILSPEAAAIGMIGVGGATAYFADGRTRVIGHSAASAGAGQLALTLMGRRALSQGAHAAPSTAALPAALAPALPAPAPAASRRAAQGGGYVLDMFRDAASQLDILDDEEARADLRDAAVFEADAYDVDDLAA